MDRWVRLKANIEKNAARKRAQLESCPEEVRPFLQAVLDLKDRYVQAITHKNRLQINLERRLYRGLSSGQTSDVETLQLERLRLATEEAHRSAEAVKEECRRAETVYRDCLAEHRIRSVPQERRDVVRRLLEEKRIEIEAANEALAALVSQPAAVATGSSTMQMELEDARVRGDHDRLGELMEQRENAQVASKEVMRLMNESSRRIAEIDAEYEKRIQALASDQQET